MRSETVEQALWSRSCRALRQRLESLRRAGVVQLVRPEPFAVQPAGIPPARADVGPAAGDTAAVAAPAARRPVARPQVEEVAGGPSAAAGTMAPAPPEDRPPSLSRPAALDVLRHEVAHCLRCPPLAASRTQTVFGVGDPEARLCFFGEAPGADEDRLGEPFVGAAGKLLDRILAACGLRREEVYILNVLKCRPPGNRTPAPEEIANCRTFFERQLQILQPEFLCCLGATAAQTLLRTTQPLGRLRGRFHDHQGIQVLVTYHPAYLLRSPDKKRDTWEDMKMLLRAMGREIP